MSQVTEQSVRFQTALASIKLIQASAVLDLTEDDFDFLTSNKVWIATDRSRARRCVEACVYGTLDFVGYPRFPAPVEFIAAVIAYYVHPVNIQTACLIMEGAEFTENIINGVERPVKAAELFAFTLRVLAGIQGDVLATDNNTVGMGDAGIKSAIQGSNVPNPDEAVPSFVSGAMAKAGNGLLEGTLQAGTSAVSDKLLDLVGLGGKSAADKGKDTRDYLAAAFPELNAWERAGADASSAGMVDAGFENQKELTKMQLDNQKEIA